MSLSEVERALFGERFWEKLEFLVGVQLCIAIVYGSANGHQGRFKILDDTILTINKKYKSQRGIFINIY